ncbi:MAG: 16S rRNA (cytosine(967)-C(5))-methyltransferase RsmB [Gammaproteobacteria bacterium]
MSARAAGIESRAAAATAVHAVLENGATLDRALDSVIDRVSDPRDRAQVRALAYGSVRWHCRHRVLLSLLLNRPLRARDRILESLLSVGLFELEYGRSPGYAAVSASVAAARRLGRPRAAGLINAALRRYQRDRSELLEQALLDETARHAHPAWLLQELRRAWPAHWEAVCAAHQEPPPMWLRVNAMQNSVAAYREKLAAVGITADAAPAFPQALRLREPVGVERLPDFASGAVSVQDAASQLAAELVAAEPGMRVLDACAAPGGKSLHMLERVGGRLDLHALDVDGERLGRLHENLARAGLSATVLTGDAETPADWWDGEAYDRILIDAPCSATGVIRRHPDIRFLRRASDLPALAQRQEALLDKLWGLLRPGGRLVYATCSLLPAENLAIAQAFLARNTDAEELRLLSGAVLEAMAGAEPGYQLLSNLADTDGFYYLVLHKHDA